MAHLNATKSLLTMILAFSVVSLASCQAKRRDFEADLLKYLKNNITDYSPTLRPTLDPHQVVAVSMTASPSHLISVDSAKQSVKIATMFFASWYEERLVWDPAMFGNISVLDWDSRQIWFPIIFVYNGMGDNQLLSPQFPTYITSVSPNMSVVSAVWKQDWEFSCQFNMTRFPHDRHTCDMELFMNDQGRGGDKVVPAKGLLLADPLTEYNELAAYAENSEWRMLNLSTFVHFRNFKMFKSLKPVPMPTYVMRMEIERVSTYYMLNVVTPLLLLTLLQVLVFFVPVESGEKLGFGITIMLSYTVFLLLLDGILPKSQSMPTVASFITAAMVLSTTSLLLTSFIIRFHFAPETSPMPSCLRFVFVSCLGRLLCVHGPGGRTQPEGDTGDCDHKASGGDDERSAASFVQRSDWQVAAVALERLMVLLGCPATLAILLAFVIVPLF